MRRMIALATMVSGTLDILFAILLTIFRGRNVGDMLRFVASGPFPAAIDMRTTGAALGLVVHFALMALMATAFALGCRRWPSLVDRPIATGVGFGLITYAIMNLIVVPLRFGAPMPPSLLSIATQLFAHIALVGVPFALIARRTLTHQRP